MTKARDYNAEYYGAFTASTDDIRFYPGFVDSQTRVLELGCGTGRVTAGLIGQVSTIVGVDISETMLERARTRVAGDADVFVQADITAVALDQHFDLVVAPFRVLQALEHNAQVDGLFDVIRAHLAASRDAH